MQTSSPLSSGQVARGTYSNDRLFVIVLFIGFLMGITVALLAGYLLWATGGLSLGNVTCHENGGSCPPAFEIEISTGTPQPESAGDTPVPAVVITTTPDLESTATAACATFVAGFPGTPCP